MVLSTSVQQRANHADATHEHGHRPVQHRFRSDSHRGRLARKLCSCKKPSSIPEEALRRAGFKDEDLDKHLAAVQPGGMRYLQESGYKGRVGIYQVMPISEEMCM